MLHLKKITFSSIEFDIFEWRGCTKMPTCEKTRTINADIAETLKKQENSGLKQLYLVSAKSFLLSQSLRFIVTIYAEVYFDSLTSGRALVVLVLQ